MYMKQVSGLIQGRFKVGILAPPTVPPGRALGSLSDGIQCIFKGSW